MATILMHPVMTAQGWQYQLKGLGAIDIPPATISNIQAATQVINTASSAIPQQSVQIQTEFSKVANKVASIAGTIASIGAVVAAVGGPVGVLVGGAVAVVGGIVAAAAALLGKIFARAKSKEFDVERAQWDAANAQLRFENNELDLKYENLKANMATLRKAVSEFTGIDFTIGKDSSVQGLGLCIFNCKAKASKELLNTSKQQYESLKKAQDEKVKLTMELLDEWDKLTLAVVNLKKEGNKNAMLIGGIAAILLIGTYFTFKD